MCYGNLICNSSIGKYDQGSHSGSCKNISQACTSHNSLVDPTLSCCDGLKCHNSQCTACVAHTHGCTNAWQNCCKGLVCDRGGHCIYCKKMITVAIMAYRIAAKGYIAKKGVANLVKRKMKPPHILICAAKVLRSMYQTIISVRRAFVSLSCTFICASSSD